LNHLAGAYHELERPSSVVRAVELTAVGESAC
jgi:hypothetical protein